MRQAYLAVASGWVETALVVGVEKFTDVTGSAEAAALTQMTDNDYESVQGVTPTTLAGLLMQRYMSVYHVPHQAFGGFAVTAHANAAHNPNAFYRRPITQETYDRSPTRRWM